jgi:translation elongation factor EF-4
MIYSISFDEGTSQKFEDEMEGIAKEVLSCEIESTDWCEDGSVRMDIKVLQKQVKALQKQAHITTEVVTTMAEMLEKLKEEI